MSKQCDALRCGQRTGGDDVLCFGPVRPDVPRRAGEPEPRIVAVRAWTARQALRTRTMDLGHGHCHLHGSAPSPSPNVLPRPAVNLRLQDVVSRLRIQTGTKAPEAARAADPGAGCDEPPRGVSVPPTCGSTMRGKPWPSSRVAQAPWWMRWAGSSVAAERRHGTAGLCCSSRAPSTEAIELARRPVAEAMYSPVAAVVPDTAPAPRGRVLLDTGPARPAGDG